QALGCGLLPPSSNGILAFLRFLAPVARMCFIARIPTGVAVPSLGRLYLTLFARIRTLAAGYGRDTAQSCGHARRCYFAGRTPRIGGVSNIGSCSFKERSA